MNPNRLGVWVVLIVGVVLAWPAREAGAQARKRLSPSDIRTEMNRHIPKIKKCGRKHRATGMVRMRLKITGADGRVQSVKILGAFAGKPVARCVIRIVRWARFPRFRARTQSFVMPIRVSSGGKLPVRLSPTEVRRAFRRVQPAVTGCGKRYGVRREARTRAKLRVVGRTGRVKKAKLLGRYSGTPVGQCVVRVLRQARFGRFTSKLMTIVWTVHLR